MPYFDPILQTIQDYMHGKTATPPPAGGSPLFWGLSTTAPAADGTNITEPTIGVGGYARVEVDTEIPVSAAQSPGAQIVNTAIITHGVSSAAWSTGATALAHCVAFTAATAGTPVFHFALTTPRAVNAAGEEIEYRIGDATLAIS